MVNFDRIGYLMTSLYNEPLLTVVLKPDVTCSDFCRYEYNYFVTYLDR